MIEKLQIRNFQNHELTRIKLDPRITTITGPSDVGKSAVIRALRWLLMNKPGGDAFLREGQQACSVTIQLDGRKVTRKKGKENKYKLDDQEFVAFGASVPEAIEQLLNVDELNIQNQHDAPFWFSLTAGEVAKRINQIVDLTIIDQVLAETAKRIREHRMVLDYITQQIQSVESQWEELQDVPRQQTLFGQLESMVATIQANQQQQSQLQDHCQQIRTQRQTIQQTKQQLQQLSRVLDLGDTLEATSLRQDRLVQLVAAIQQATTLTKQQIPNLRGLEQIQQQWQQIKQQQSRLSRLCQEARNSREDFEDFSGKLADVLRIITTEANGICPACGNKLRN